MSSSGSCPKVLAAERLGYEPVPETAATLRIFKESSRHEDFVIEDLEAEGYLISDRQKEYTLETPIITLIGHIDGVAHKDSNTHLLEVKALGRFTFDRFKRQGLSIYPGYQAQITCYAEVTKFLPILLAVKCRDTGEIIKSFLDKPPMDFASILNRLHEVELCVRDEVLPEVTFDEKSDQCRWCRFKYLCSKEEKEVKVEEVSLPDLIETARIYVESKELQKEAEEKLNWARGILLNHAKENKLDKFRVTNVSISYRGQKVKEYLDEKLIRERAPIELIAMALRTSQPYDDYSIRILGGKILDK